MNFVKKEKKKVNDLESDIGRSVGNYASANAQNASNVGIDGMAFFRTKVTSLGATNFDQAKGGLFEYIEAAKFNVDAASKGINSSAIVTDAVGRPHAEADIEIYKNGSKVKDIQAKFIKTTKDGRDTSAASSVHHHTGAQNKGWGQYDGMDRLVRKQENYHENESLAEASKRLAKEASKKGGIHADTYKDVSEHITDETHYENVSSGGTTIEEVEEAYKNSEKYIESFEQQQFRQEILTTTTSMAAASFVTTGIISGVFNFCKFLKNEKTAKDAIEDTAKDATKGAIRGAATGAVSSSIRIAGVKAGNELLSNSSSSMAIAGGIIDGGVALFKYAKGEIDSRQLKEELTVTVVKSTSMVCLSNAISALTGGAINPFISMAIYVSLGSIINCCREIICNAKMNIAESDRLAAIYKSSFKEREQQYKELDEYLKEFSTEQRNKFDKCINRLNYNFETGENYDEAINAIVDAANCLNIELQHVEFSDFKNVMLSDESFKLE